MASSPSAAFLRLRTFIAERMRMRPIDQPLKLSLRASAYAKASSRRSGRVLLAKHWAATATHLQAPATVNNNWSPALPARRVVNDLLTLPLAQRLELVQTLWDSIAAEQIGPELTEPDRQLIDQRLERFLADGDPGLDADAVLDSLEQSL
jgi:putative addiction module component (TIGR02574 family)